jgi:hypothetical protein
VKVPNNKFVSVKMPNKKPQTQDDSLLMVKKVMTGHMNPKPQTQDDSLFMVKQVMMKHWGLMGEQHLRIKGSLSPKLLAAFRICCYTENELSDAARDPEDGPVSPDNEESALEALQGGLHSMLSAFPHTAEEDEQLLQGACLSPLVRACIQYRLSQKRILARNIKLVDDMVSELPALRDGWVENEATQGADSDDVEVSQDEPGDDGGTASGQEQGRDSKRKKVE